MDVDVIGFTWCGLVDANIEKENIRDKKINGIPLLSWAIANGESHILYTLLQTNINIESRDSNGETALHYAAKFGGLKPLLKAGADIEARSYTGLTPLHCAAAFGNVEHVKILLESGANPKSVTNNGRTVRSCSRNKVITKLLDGYKRD